MNNRRQSLGRWGEDMAADYLQAKGYEIIARNVRSKRGEIDLVALEGKSLIFVEVKTRSSDDYGFPEAAVTHRKQQTLVHCAQAFLLNHPEWGDDWRIDVIAIRKAVGDASPEIVHYQDAVSY
jgi:putative endonuclease